ADGRVAIRRLLELRAQGERTTGLIWNMARRLREAIAVSNALAAGQPAAEIKRSMRMPRDAADRFLKDVQARDVESLRRALAAIADLEVESRGGSGGVLSEDTAAVRAVLAAAF